ncbi:MAG: NnrS family protein [Rhodocyclales bacterium]|nr:NnrS family protein [Rhodocyclales bacterium]
MNLRPVFFAAPHRVMFFAGALQALLGMAFWAFDLGARYAGLYTPLSWPVPATWLHAALMLYGLFTFFIFGFLMTALPKWVAQGPLEQRQYVPAFFLLVAGWLLFYAGLFAAPLIPLGMVVVAAGWGLGWYALFAAVRSSISEHKTHAWVVLVALACGIVGLLAFAAGIALTHPGLVAAAIEAGLWLFLVPVFFTVTYRMLPFFSGSVIRGYDEYRGRATYWIVLGCCAAHAALAVAELRAWLWPPDLLGGATVLWLSWRWQLRKAFVSHLLAMHHLASVWLGIALLLFAVQSLFLLSGNGWGGRAPLHALTVGYFGSILIGMATRVTLGHSGRLISSDVWAWRLFWLFQGVVLLRLGGEWFTELGAFSPVWLSALGWLAVFGMWGRVHLSMFLKPRPDGRPG